MNSVGSRFQKWAISLSLFWNLTLNSSKWVLNWYKNSRNVAFRSSKTAKQRYAFTLQSPWMCVYLCICVFIFVYFIFKSSGMRRLVAWCMFTDVLEKPIGLVPGTEDSNWIWRQYVPSKLIPQAAWCKAWVWGHYACWDCGFESRQGIDVCPTWLLWVGR
jgi:hypothetical protein